MKDNNKKESLKNKIVKEEKQKGIQVQDENLDIDKEEGNKGVGYEILNTGRSNP